MHMTRKRALLEEERRERRRKLMRTRTAHEIDNYVPHGPRDSGEPHGLGYTHERTYPLDLHNPLKSCGSANTLSPRSPTVSAATAGAGIAGIGSGTCGDVAASAD
eukprot:8050809-Pyramimonas_sp.AAC.1